MKNKKLEFGQDSRKKLMEGATELAAAVKATLGPRGRNVVIQQPGLPPRSTKDGVSVASEVQFKDHMKNMGAQIVKQAASKTADEAGDATTSSTVLAEGMIKRGMKMVAADHDPMSIKRGMDKVATALVDKVKAQARPIETTVEVKQVATISANGDEDIGNMIAEAMDNVGKDGFITLEEGGAETKLHMSQGYEFDRGYIDPAFCNNVEKMRVEFEDARIWLVDRKLSSNEDLEDMMPILQECGKKGIKLVLIADAIEDEVLWTMALNARRRSLKCVCIRAPGFGDRKYEMLEDLAVFTGATLRDSRQGESTFEDLSLDDFGYAAKVVVSKENTAIVGVGGNEDEIKSRLDQITTIIGDCESPHEREMHEKRRARLAGGVAVIKVGGANEIEMKERRDRFDDALCATRSAVEEGIVPGGGLALVRARSELTDFTTGNPEEDVGVKVVLDSVADPMATIAANAGLNGEAVVQKTITDLSGNHGFNAAKMEYMDLLEAGVVDPTKVVRVALENAVSVAGLFVTTEAVISFDDEDELNQVPNPMMAR